MSIMQASSERDLQICSADDCMKNEYRRGFCDSHYRKRLSSGEITRVAINKCSVDGCGGKHKANGLCSIHYKRMRLNGTLETTLTQVGIGLQLILDTVASPPPDKCVVWPYGVTTGDYPSVRYEGETWAGHRLALYLYTGVLGKQACHGPCHNPCCFNPHPNHGMYWGDAKTNAADQVRDGSVLLGSKRVYAVLNEEIVTEVFLDNTKTQSEWASLLGVSPTAISNVKTGRNWGWLTSQL